MMKKKRRSISLHEACESGDIELARRLIGLGADVNLMDSLGWSPLFYACEAGAIDVIELLIDRGADADVTCNGKTMLQRTICRNRADIVHVLLAAGASANKESNNGVTPLQLTACHSGLVDHARLLIRHGADLNGKVHTVMTPMYLACICDNVEMVSLLLDAGAPVFDDERKQLIDAANWHDSSRVLRFLTKNL